MKAAAAPFLGRGGERGATATEEGENLKLGRITGFGERKGDRGRKGETDCSVGPITYPYQTSQRIPPYLRGIEKCPKEI